MNGIPNERIRAELDKITGSTRFVNAHKLTRFLRLVVEEDLAGRGDQIKEYTVGVEVYNRPEGYDPRVDATVRVEAAKLRKRLSEYYAGEGRDDRVVITIPKGRYAPVFDERVVEGPARRRLFPWRRALIAGICLPVGLAVSLVIPTKHPLRLGAERRIPVYPGSHTSASFSPDGAMIAFICKTDGGTAQVCAKSLALGETQTLTSDGPADAARPRWSPKNDQIVFERRGRGIWSVRPFGGPEARRIIEQGRSPDFSPDGEQLVFVKGPEMWVARADGGGQRRVLGAQEARPGIDAPAFSPDGRWIAYFHSEFGPLGDLWLISSAGGRPRRLTYDAQEGGDPVWTPDGRWIVYASARSGSHSLWRVAFEGGTPEPVTTGAGEDTAPAISRDGKSLIFSNARDNTWSLDLLDTSSGVQTELLSRPEDIAMPAFSPEGDRIAYFQHLNGEIHLFVVGADGKGLRQVTRDRGQKNAMPAWSADGNFLFFYQIRPNLSFRKLAISGGVSVEVAPWTWGAENFARVDSGGHAVVYTQSDSIRPLATKVRDLATGRETALAEVIRWPQWSGDDRSILGATEDDRIVVCPVAGSACRFLTRGNRPRWSGGGSNLYFFRSTGQRDYFELWSAASDGSNEKRIGRLGPFREFEVHFDVSSRGQVVWVPFHEGRQELWLAEIRR